MSNDVETLSKLLEKSSMALLRTVIPLSGARSEITSLYAMRVLQGRCDYKAAAESMAKLKGITDRKKIDELADILKGTPEDEQRAAEISDEYRNAKKKIEAMSATDRAALFETSLNELKPLLIDVANVCCQQRDKFIAQGVKDAPDTIDAAVMVCRDAIDTTALSITTMGGTDIVLSLGLLPPEAMHNAETMRKAKEIAASFLDVETTAQYILDAMPETMGYLRQHAPAIAGTLETHARRKIQESTSPLWECFDSVIEAAEAPAALQTVPILKRIDGTDKLTQAIFAGKVGRNYVNVAMETAGSAKEVTSAICLLDYDGFTLPNGQPLVLTPFLYELYNAVCSIRAAGNRFTTYNMINKVMTGKTGRGKSKEVNLKPERKELLRKGLQILRVGVSMDIREEVDAGYIKDEKLKGTRFEKLKNAKKRPTYIDDVLLDTRVIGNVEIDGHMMDEVIEIKDEPILYSYSKMRGQVSTYPLEVLNAPIRNTADNMAVRGILIRWILMGDKKKDFYKLNYEKIFEAVGISAADKSSGTNKRRTQIRKCVDDCLIYWKKIKFIHNYEVTRRGMKYLSISVTTPEQIEEWKGKQQHKRKAH